MNLVTLALIVAAALVLGGRDLLKHGREFVAQLPIPELSSRQIGAAALLMAAIVSWHWSQAVSPAPSPTPPPAGPLDLRGLFRGPQAAEDAALVGSLCGELADELEWDGLQSDPLVKTAIAIDELRQRARELRCRGVSIGARQPAARDAIARHLEDKVGTAGGPITPEQRSTWVAAFRDIERAADNVVR